MNIIPSTDNTEEYLKQDDVIDYSSEIENGILVPAEFIYQSCLPDILASVQNKKLKPNKNICAQCVRRAKYARNAREKPLQGMNTCEGSL